jgi:hypothetical protein
VSGVASGLTVTVACDGFEVLTVHDQALQRASDDRVAQVAREEARPRPWPASTAI